ncbi:DNA gyrase/topoisomerase IV subunit A [Chryseolinea sp. T2]|uniref:DNA gyrase/topoisomerase IV subunit A n=1 Tax=Chryseolinea sp. T2 TaxID=3129255 RepID=UPI003077F140
MSKKKKSDDESEENELTQPTNGNGKSEDVIHSIAIDGLYQNWFLDYASYVILERAVPRIEDGFKPVQRRIMHALKEMDDGRLNKVANVIGNTMQYHPHGDASIGEAIVNIGQKDLLFDKQGNWGDVRTGDGAAAPRYIEVRLSKFALDIAYNAQTTEWQLSYDGRKREPVTLPVKFPLLLSQGVEGIAVGLSTKILPHNFSELIKASIDVLKGKNPKIFPDFLTGGIADFTDYNQGLRGGKIKVRARIEIVDKKTLIIREIPFSTTTTSLMESIVKASEKGQIKVKQVIDKTAQDIEIQIHLQPGQSPEIAMDALYAFTDCEISISPNACVIVDDKPQFMPVNQILKVNTGQTMELLRQELEIKKSELLEKILFSSLEKIFIEKRIYRDIEEAESWEEVIETIDKGLKPYKKKFYREITRDDIVRLTEIRIKRISKYDSFKADELMRDQEKELKETEHHLKHLTDYAIAYFQNLLEKYGKGRERRTEIKGFQSVAATDVIANNQKLYVNRVDGFIGYGLKRDENNEFVTDCSDLDDVIVVRKDGKAKVSRIADKVFMGKDILYVGIWKKNDDRMVYNVVYTDGKSGKGFSKRFNMPGMTRDKEYPIATDDKNSRIHYVSGNPNGEAETVEVTLSQSSTARKKVFEYDFAELEVKGRAARGNTITKYPIRKVKLLQAGASTLSKLSLWYDDAAGRLNREERGKYLGKFDADDKLITFTRNGNYKITNYDLSNRFDPEKTLLVQKFNPARPVSAIYVDGESKLYMVKRFMIETTTLDKEFNFISEAIGSRLILATTAESAEIEVDFISGKNKDKKTDVMNLDELIDVKGWKAVGNRLSLDRVTKVTLVSDQEEASAGDDAGEDEDGGAGSEGDQAKKKEQPEQHSSEPTELFQSKPSHLSEDQQRLLRGQPKSQPQSQPESSQQPRPESQQASQQTRQPESQQPRQQENQQARQPESQQAKHQKHPASQQAENQQSLFGSPEKSKEEKVDGTKPKDDKSFGVGDTIEFDI